MPGKKNRVNMGTMIAAMFYRNQPISEIMKMNYNDLKNWYKYHEIIEETWVKAKNEALNGK